MAKLTSEDKVKLSSNNIVYTKQINDNFSKLDSGKVDVETGKGLSTNDFTEDYKNKLDGIEAGANKYELPTDVVKDANYVHTDKNFTEAYETKLTGIAEGAQVNVIEKITVDGTELSITDKTAAITIGEKASYTIAEQETAESGYAKTYILNKTAGGTTTQVGAKINIPKDLVVNSGTVETVTTADQPYAGAVVGDKYIDLVLNNDGATHIYVPAKDLVDVYTGGNGIDVTNSSIAIKVDTTNANGLNVTTDGLKLGLASATENGAMSSSHYSKLEGINTDNIQANVIETVKVNGTALTPDNKAVDVSVPTAIFKSIKVGTDTINSTTTTDTLEIAGGDNVTVTADTANKKVTIGVTIPEGGTQVQTTSFQASTEGWSTVDTNGNYTLTLAHGKTSTPTILTVKKVSTDGGYESCMANARVDATNFYITADIKFEGMIIYY